MNRRLRGIAFTIPGVVIGFVGASSCAKKGDPGPGPGTGDPFNCGLVCQERGVADGNASISGIGSLDAFFASCLRFQSQADSISDGIAAELNAIASSVGAGWNDTEGLKARLLAKLEDNVDGTLKISYARPKCTVSAQATLQALAKCDPSVDPGSASVQCLGSCTVDSGATVACGSNATLACTGVAPDLQCSGSCQGDCDLNTAARCSGTCHGRARAIAPRWTRWAAALDTVTTCARAPARCKPVDRVAARAGASARTRRQQRCATPRRRPIATQW